MRRSYTNPAWMVDAESSDTMRQDDAVYYYYPQYAIFKHKTKLNTRKRVIRILSSTTFLCTISSPNASGLIQLHSELSNVMSQDESAIPQQNPTELSIPDKLQNFRDILGIHALPADFDSAARPRPAENQGTYKRLVDAELKARMEYYFSASIINTGLVAQLVFAATLTVLGASQKSFMAVTLLGSVNTVIAGGMAYLKGQGLPERLVQYANDLRKVREHLEERERQFMRPDCPLDVDQESRIILRMYQAARQKAEDSAIREAAPAKQNKEAKNKTAHRNTMQPIVETEAALQADEEVFCT